MPGPNKSFSDVNADSVDATNTTTDTLNGADILNMTAGEILESDGAGNLQPAAAGGSNTPDWELDANSPSTATGVTSHTVNISGSYDVLDVWVKMTDNSGSANNLDLRLNGDSGTNYDYLQLDGTSVGNDTEFQNIGVCIGNSTGTFRFTINPRGTGDVAFTNQTLDNSATRCHAGRNGNVTSPVSSLTFLSANADYTVEVFGRST